MSLPFHRPLEPMEAETVGEIPSGPGWQYEPKWDGFRCLAFREGDRVELQSKAMKPLERYFPDIVTAARALAPRDFVLDGELVIPVEGRLSFDELQLRLHPAESRVRKLAGEHPAVYIVFDLLAEGRSSLLQRPLRERRRRLEALAERHLDDRGAIRLSPATGELDKAHAWYREVGGDLDGIIAKRVDEPYRVGERAGMVKIKSMRTADCVVGGFRTASGSRGARAPVASLLLGLYDDAGVLHHVGHTSGLSSAERVSLEPRLRSLVKAPGFTGRAPGGPSRWAAGRNTEWHPLQPRLVVEVLYDHFTGGRFRHGTRLLRWRPDKDPRSCTFDQLGAAGAGPLALLQGVRAAGSRVARKARAGPREAGRRR